MKISSVQNQAFNNKIGSQNTKGAKNTSFGSLAFTPAMVEFWSSIDRGGLAASFILQDFAGTIGPRTAVYTYGTKTKDGKPNFLAGAESLLRELLTGPSMFAIPAGILALSMRLCGKANRVPVNNIEYLSEILKQTAKNNPNLTPENFKEVFYKDVFNTIFSNTFDNQKDIKAEEYAAKLIEREKTKNRNVFKSIFNKPFDSSNPKILGGDQLEEQLVNMFVKDKKAHSTAYGDFLSAKLAKGADASAINDILKDMRNFSDDVIKTLGDKKNFAQLGEEFIEKFKHSRKGTRIATNVLMVAATALFMTFVPKLYSLSKKNPELEALEGSKAQGKEAQNVNK